MQPMIKQIARMMLAGGVMCASMAVFAQSVEEVKIGCAAPMTGSQAHYGEDFRNGVLLAVEDFNATKPIIGGKSIRIELKTGDDQADPRTATTIAQQLVDQGIKGMLGHFNSGTTIPASRIYANAGIPQIAMATAPEYTQQGFKTTFRMMTSDTQQGAVIGAFAVKRLGFKKIAIVDDRTAYGQGLANQFEKAAKAAGAKIVGREYSNDKAVDFKGILTKLKRANPQAIFYGGADAQAAPMVKQMQTLDMKAVLMAGEMVKSDTFLKLAGKAAEGTVVSLAGRPLDEMPGGKEYAIKYKNRFKENVQTYSPYAYDGAMAMFTAMQKADSTDPVKYLPFLAKIDMQSVTMKKLAYDARGDLKQGDITVYKAENEQWKVLSDNK
ncbi:amino-acid transport protein [Mycoavidus cysteinexigens]|uniref:Amino-acid transport protein n=2 Tax=Mycoavidus cysteinexigens TaxID=1553431 RepID=A0A2Z6ES31_9BURK|nr:branched-chain amino acid ABC transporter substrate-binding protein [Mycoavidus cysteinexigens]BBE08205.1 amino-acid transport protein [Mycoavidus cysteinexigens]GAM53090.1 leucine-, isoleucine-, valine-, threonine-, and alanine-binding protein [bacterium endosymbiont of Mortierella elongata FMR23-6]GLR01999.1 branched chain amino acid ABC transporter substrate-binding protein [Mycoavidus cysteinexigens]